MIAFIVSTLPGILYTQHHEWTIVTGGGSTFEEIHPDTLRHDSLGFSDDVGAFTWIPLDSVHSLQYRYNPFLLPLIVVGGLIGGISTENDNGTAFSPIGALIGAIVGTLLSYLIEEITSENLDLTGMNPVEKREAIRRVVPKWTGRVVVLD